MAASGVSSKCFGLFCRVALGVGFLFRHAIESTQRSPTNGTPPQTSFVTSSTSAVFPRSFRSLPTFRYIYWNTQLMPMSGTCNHLCPCLWLLAHCGRHYLRVEGDWALPTQTRGKQINIWISKSTPMPAKGRTCQKVNPWKPRHRSSPTSPSPPRPFHQTRPRSTK